MNATIYNAENTSISISPLLIKILEDKKHSSNSDTSAFHSGCPVCDLNQNSDKLFSKKKRAYNGTVDPIKDRQDIQTAKEYFLNQYLRYKNDNTNIRNYLLFVMGINCARRIGDILRFQIKDFIKADGSFKEHFAIKEEKTNKPIKIKINKSIQEALTLYLSTLPSYTPEDYLFKSREGNNQPMETRSVSRIMKEMSRACGFEARGININTHSMRKTWAYHMYMKDHTNIVMIQKALNHSSPAVTLRYIGIEQEEMDEMFDCNNL